MLCANRDRRAYVHESGYMYISINFYTAFKNYVKFVILGNSSGATFLDNNNENDTPSARTSDAHVCSSFLRLTSASAAPTKLRPHFAPLCGRPHPLCLPHPHVVWGPPPPLPPSALFASLKRQAEKYCSLICSERKILFLH